MPKVQLRQRQTTKTKGRSSAGMQIMGAAAKPAQLRHPWHQTLIRNDRCGMTGARPGEAGRDRPQRSRTPPGDQFAPGAATIIESACPTCTQVPNMRSQSREIEHGIRAIDCPKDHSRSPGIPRRRLPSFAGRLPMRSGPLRGTRGSGDRGHRSRDLPQMELQLLQSSRVSQHAHLHPLPAGGTPRLGLPNITRGLRHSPGNQ